MKERWFNYRPICLVFAFLLLGTIFSFYIKSFTIFTITVSSSVILALILLAIIKKKPQYALVPLIAFAVGIGAYYLAVYSFNRRVNYTPEIVHARVYNISNESNGMIAVECDSVKFDGKDINDNVLLYIYDNSGLFENIDIGSIIEFKPYNFYKSDLFYYETPNAKLFANDLKYTISVLHSDIKYIETDRTFNEVLKDKIEENLYLGLTNENAEIAYSALFGDKSSLSTSQYNAYKLSGIAHLLAVSGLHVGIIFSILNWTLSKLNVRKWYKFSIISLFLLCYTYICGFSISIVRASIMYIVFMLSGVLGKEYDSLTSISIAGIIAFLINPLCVFDVGFLLSFGCVTGITLLHKPIENALIKFKTPKKIAQGLAISISTTITIAFIMAYYFHTLNIISIIANLTIIPIFTFAFIPIFVVSILSIVSPYIAYLLYPINYILSFINVLATMLGGLAISNFNTTSFNYIAIIVYFLLLLFVSRFCTAKHQYKLATALPMVALLFYCLL